MSSKICYVTLEVELSVGIVKFGETGYWATNWGRVADTIDDLENLVDTKNKRMGVSPAEWRAMQSCSMFDCWGNYEKIKSTYERKFGGDIS